MNQNLIDVHLLEKIHKLDLLKQFLPNIKFPEEIKIENQDDIKKIVVELLPNAQELWS